MKTLSLLVSIYFIVALFPAQNIPYVKMCLDYGIMDSSVKVDSSKTDFFERTDFGFYSFKSTYYIDSIHRIEITNLLEKITVYEHYKNNVLKSKGELIEDKTDFITDSMYYDVEKPVGYYSTFSLIANGYWEIYSENGTKEAGNYLNGKKTGVWKTLVMHSPFSNEDSHLREKIYENDSLISVNENTNTIDEEHKDLILKKWFFYYLPYRINDSTEFIYLSTEQFDSNRRNRNYRTFMKDGEYTDRVYFSCGVGLTQERVHPTGKWSIKKKNTLIIDGKEATVLLLTDQYLILSFGKK